MGLGLFLRNSLVTLFDYFLFSLFACNLKIDVGDISVLIAVLSNAITVYTLVQLLLPFGTQLFIRIISGVSRIIAALKHVFVIMVISVESPICSLVIYVSTCHYFRALGVYACKAVLCIGITHYTACVGGKIRCNSVGCVSNCRCIRLNRSFCANSRIADITGGSTCDTAGVKCVLIYRGAVASELKLGCICGNSESVNRTVTDNTVVTTCNTADTYVKRTVLVSVLASVGGKR